MASISRDTISLSPLKRARASAAATRVIADSDRSAAITFVFGWRERKSRTTVVARAAGARPRYARTWSRTGTASTVESTLIKRRRVVVERRLRSQQLDEPVGVVGAELRARHEEELDRRLLSVALEGGVAHQREREQTITLRGGIGLGEELRLLLNEGGPLRGVGRGERLPRERSREVEERRDERREIRRHRADVTPGEPVRTALDRDFGELPDPAGRIGIAPPEEEAGALEGAADRVALARAHDERRASEPGPAAAPIADEDRASDPAARLLDPHAHRALRELGCAERPELVTRFEALGRARATSRATSANSVRRTRRSGARACGTRDPRSRRSRCRSSPPPPNRGGSGRGTGPRPSAASRHRS